VRQKFPEVGIWRRSGNKCDRNFLEWGSGADLAISGADFWREIRQEKLSDPDQKDKNWK
jgi:hypothetical protein